MTLDEVLASLRDVDTELGADERTSAQKILLEELLAAADTDINAIAAAVTEKGRNVDPTSSDITEETLEEFSLLSLVSDAVNHRVSAIEEQREKEQRSKNAAALAARIAQTRMLEDPPPDGGTSGVTAGAIVPAGSGTGNGMQQMVRRETLEMTAASDMPGYFSGQTIASMEQLTSAVIGRARSLSRSSSNRQVPVASMGRHYPETHVVADEMRDWHKIVQASNERALQGGSLAANLLKRTGSASSANSLTAQGYAWCAPMELRDELCPVEGSLDNMLDLPTIVTNRGGVMWPATPDFTGLYEPFCFTDADVGPGYEITKPCVQMPCPDGWDECKLQGCSLCLETGIIQSRVDPSQVQRAIQEMMIAHQRHLNRMRIQAMVDEIESISGAHTDLTDWGAHGPGLVESLLSFVELQAEHLRTRRRLAMSTTIEAVFPRWVLGVLRSDLSKKNAINDRWSIGEADVTNYLLTRGIRPQFVWDWQDDVMGAEGNPEQWPSEVTFMMYQAGAFTAIAGPSIQLEMIHDKALIQANREIRLFVEDMWCVIHRCGAVASFTVPLCPNGVSGGQVVQDCPAPAALTASAERGVRVAQQQDQEQPSVAAAKTSKAKG